MSHYGLVQSVGPLLEPVTLSDMKLQLKEDQTENDNLIETYISAAREMVEEHTRRRFVSQTYQWTLDSFSGYPLVSGQRLQGDVPFSQIRGGGPHFQAIPLEIPLSPVMSVTSVEYVAVSDSPTPPYTYTTLALPAYDVDLASQPARLTPGYGTTWPVALNVPNAVRVTFVTGCTPPARLKMVVMLLVGGWYMRRQDVETSRRMGLPVGIKSLLASLDSGKYP